MGSGIIKISFWAPKLLNFTQHELKKKYCSWTGLSQVSSGFSNVELMQPRVFSTLRWMDLNFLVHPIFSLLNLITEYVKDREREAQTVGDWANIKKNC